MKLRHVVPFVMLFAWQSAPSPDSTERPTRLRYWFGGGTSSFDYRYWGTAGGGCNDPGRPQIFRDAARSTAVGFQAEGWRSRNVRVSTALGFVTDADGHGGPFAAGLFAWESSRIGLGAGWAGAPERAAYGGPSGYLRLGAMEGTHLRAELRTPTSAPGATGWARAGLAINQRGNSRGLAIYLGLSAVEAGPDTTYAARPGQALARLTRPAFFADAVLPLGSRLDLFARGHVGRNARGFGLGFARRLER